MRHAPLRLSEALPIVVEIVDAEESINAFLPELDGLIGEGLVTLEKVRVIVYREGEGANLMTQQRRTWTRDELLVVFRLYCRTPFGRLNKSNPDIIELARLINRTPSAVSMKACNFASLDPHHQARNVSGLQHASQADRDLWESFAENSVAIATSAEAAYESIHRRETKEPYEPVEPTGLTEVESHVKVRRVQSFFRTAVLTAYEGRCAITGLAMSELLNASHIIPWKDDTTRRADPRNGICLNALHDRAFDRGLISFDDKACVLLSSKITEDVSGRVFAAFFSNIRGVPLVLPARFHPDREALEYHRDKIFIP